MIKISKVSNNAKELSVIVKGVVGGQNQVYFDRNYLIDEGISKIRFVQYNVKIVNAKELKAFGRKIVSFSNSIQLQNQPFRVTCYELQVSQSIGNQIATINILVAIIVMFLMLTILIIHKNNVAINIHDNMNSFAILRCISMEKSKIFTICFVETVVESALASAVGCGICFAFKGVIGSVVNRLLRTNLIDSSLAIGMIAWWSPLVILGGILLLSSLYIWCKMSSFLHRGRIISTLRSETYES